MVGGSSGVSKEVYGGEEETMSKFMDDLPLYIVACVIVGYPIIAAWGFFMAVKEAVCDE